MRVAVNSHALPIHKKNRIASLLCIFETIIIQVHFMNGVSDITFLRPLSTQDKHICYMTGENPVS